MKQGCLVDPQKFHSGDGFAPSHNAAYPFRDHIQVVSMATRALFGVFGLTSLMRAVIMGETLLFPETFELEATL